VLIHNRRAAGFLGSILSPAYFIKSQLPPSAFTNAQITVLDSIVSKNATTTLLAWQLGNIYLLVGLLGLFVLNTTSELKVVKAYLLALWIGDIGHVGLTLYAMGPAASLDFASWNPIVWGNVAFTAFLFAMRSLYFAGAFGNAKSITVKKD